MNILDQKEDNFKSICRICLTSTDHLYNIVDSDASSMLKFCGFLEVVESNEFPNKICKVCIDMLLQSYKLKQLCLSSQLYWQSLVNDKGVISTIPVKSLCATTNSDFGRLHADEDNSENNSSKQTETQINSPPDFQSSLAGNTVLSKDSFNETLDETLDTHIIISESKCQLNNSQHDSDNDTNISGDSELEKDKQTSFHCTECKIQFNYKQDLLVHQSVHLKNLCCNACNKPFQTIKTLKRHVKTHMLTKSHICKTCNKGFAESAALVKHTRRHHLGLPREKKYICNQCGQRFTDQYYLNLHQRKHTGEKPFECKICNKCFYDPRSHKIHMDTHKGKKLYLCSDCGKSFVQSSHLKQHLVVHTKEKRYQCKICNKRFTQSTSLHRHKNLHLDMFYLNNESKRDSRKEKLVESIEENKLKIEDTADEDCKTDYSETVHK